MPTEYDNINEAGGIVATKTKRRKREPNPNLRPTQIKVLKVLIRASADSESTALKLVEVARKVRVSKVMVHYAVGASDPRYRAQHDKKRMYRSLLTRGYVKVVQYPDERSTRYYITASGERAYEEFTQPATS